MLRRIPVVDSSFCVNDLFHTAFTLTQDTISEKFKSGLSELTGLKRIYLMNSATSAFYLILEVLKRLSNKKEVILPAYTAGNLILAIQKAGLKPVLCDVSLKDFNADPDSLVNAVSSDTLAILLVHMFGIGIEYAEDLRKKIPAGIFLIEDCAQSMGTIVNQKTVGGLCDASIFSFGRGKNLSTNGGGFLSINAHGLMEAADKFYNDAIQDYVKLDNFLEPLKDLLFCFITNPWIYGLTYPLVKPFKAVTQDQDFLVSKNTPFQASLGLLVLERTQDLIQDRYQKGMVLINDLKITKNIILPKIPEDMRPAFYRLPALFEDLKIKKKIQKRLWEYGIELSLMYEKPLHHMFELGYKADDFSNAVYMAEHLLALPVHSGIGERELSRMSGIILEIANK